ncbi:hypothetical protein chiPu_0009095 [Chiloscyllium punctatum]|uniref:Uncharacterized protein n=1 Tax=Chiloscyllium punctatum TaxID=137246 RepID=A0A401SJQ9_CHIPU|nr:hypothetical protein [Chiloscyllium punctatum]
MTPSAGEAEDCRRRSGGLGGGRRFGFGVRGKGELHLWVRLEREEVRDSLEVVRVPGLGSYGHREPGQLDIMLGAEGDLRRPSAV